MTTSALYANLLSRVDSLVKEAAPGLGTLAALGAGAAGLGGGAYLLGKSSERGKSVRNRNLAFGAGLAAGTLAPKVVGRGAELLKTLQTSFGPARARNPYDQYRPHY